MKKKKKKPDSPFVKDCKPSENAKNEMSPLLEQLFYGDIKPGLQRPTPAYQAVVGRISNQEHEISALLGKNKKLFTTYLEEGVYDWLDVANMECFSQGYRLGARLMLVALIDSDLPFPVKT